MFDVRPVEDRDAALIPRLHHDLATRDRDQRTVVRDAVLLTRLGSRHLVIRVELELVVLDREERVGAPLRLVRIAAARLRAAAPLVGEQDLLAVVAERRRVPERHVGVRRRVDADRVRRIVDVEEQAEARARATREADLRIDGDVVALIGTARRPCVRSGVAAARTGRGAPGAASGAPPGAAPAAAARAAAASARALASSASRSALRGGTGRPLKMRGELTIAACAGVASGTLITSSRKRAVFGSSIPPSAHPGSSSAGRTRAVPET